MDVSNTRITPLQPQSDGMVERDIKMIEENVRKVIAFNQRDWDATMLPYRANMHDTTSLIPETLVFGRDLRLSSDNLFETRPEKEQPTTDYAADFVGHLHEIHNYARKDVQVASHRLKTLYDKIANCACYQEVEIVTFSPNLHERNRQSFNHLGKALTGKSPKLMMWRIESEGIRDRRLW
jgi:hypothetical protein